VDHESEFLEELKTLLLIISTGQEALEIKERYEVKVEVEANGGSQFLASSNTIEIDSAYDLTQAALTFVHETTHAQYRHEGLSQIQRPLTGRNSSLREWMKKWPQPSEVSTPGWSSRQPA
jgi:hypothetical protein